MIYSVFAWIKNKKWAKKYDVSEVKRPTKGVFKTFKDVPQINQGYHNEDWLENISNEIKSRIQRIKEAKFLPPASRKNSITSLLPLVVSLISGKNGKTVILDFGGGMGVGYLNCLQSLPDFDGIFYVIDTIPNNKYARTLFNNRHEVEFFDLEIPEPIKEVDIVYIGSSLQYVENYEKVIHRLASLNPDYIFLTDIFMGTMPTFATLQVNIKEIGIALWIFSYEEIIRLLNDEGYSLIYKSSNFQPFYDFGNFPAEFELRDSYNLLFGKKA